MTQHRIDVTPQPGQFDDDGRRPKDGVSFGEVVLLVIALVAIGAVVVGVDEVWSRLAGVLFVTGALAAVIAQRVDVRRHLVRTLRR